MTPQRWSRLKEVFGAALETPESERPRFLESACEGDTELRAEVERLLAGNQELSWQSPMLFPVIAEPSSGDMVAHYRIEAKLGEGGMGVVYRAHDSRLGRDVAIKFLSEHMAGDPQSRARFEREARAVAALSHPNICPLYDVGPNYLVMELSEGETLAARLKRGKLSIQETLRYGAQIADALAAPHAKGITHRDLKPGNLLITKSRIKVLDFGLAKSPQDATLTASRVVMGTPGYMAPEQRAGKACDARTDIYALGLVLYEMASGKRQQPDQPVPLDGVPGTFAHVVERCLEGDPEDRWQSARDVQWELEWAATSRTDAPPVGAPPRRNLVPWAMAAALAVGLASVAFLHFRERPPAPAAPVRFLIQAPENATLGPLLKLSPDGRKLAFIAGSRLWVHSLESGESRDLTASSGTPFWSPDSRYIGYPSEGELKKIEATGGPPQTVTDYRSLWGGGAWNQDNMIVFSDRLVGLFRVPATGGVPVQITALDPARRETLHAFPSFLPDGRHFVYTRRSSDLAKSAIYLGSVDVELDQQSSKPLANSNWHTECVPSANPGIDYLLFVSGGTLMAQPFDNRRLELMGQPAPVAEQLNDGRAFSSSANNILVFQPSPASNVQFAWYDREGKVLETAGDPGDYKDFALSPDGTQLAVTKGRLVDTTNIWLLDLTRGGASIRFTFGSLVDTSPVWSPDRSRIIYSSNRDGPYNLYQKPANSVKDEEILLKSSDDKFATSWSRDGRFLLYTVVHPRTKNDLWVLPLDQDKKPVPLLITEFNERQARFSPDGRWVAYTSDESGQDEVYVRSFSMNSVGTAVEASGKWPISTNGFGSDPRWRGDGRELLYRSRSGRVLAVEIATKPAFRAGRPQTLGSFTGAWDSTADGKRFLVLASKSTPQPYTVVLNWQAALKK